MLGRGRECNRNIQYGSLAHEAHLFDARTFRRLACRSNSRAALMEALSILLCIVLQQTGTIKHKN